ncbi:MAG: hypothetical protein GTO42_08565 [Candidatus Latescibacteria bacterium]|nr:hypothetical protein [Candidatus Latescibacterota bacterium]NIO29011.1 hypothetical protein [Candidatus Latescibacterota bacterium]NIO56636.1 hypothetical protein [Candidatus Latescibacterota bacterium]NIT02220.1 hypothetical protein [Candidatus Latescibacterota bacterium]NIT39105.1 hypothetical protein [Candidatus Latescibacterota bacterium]
MSERNYRESSEQNYRARGTDGEPSAVAKPAVRKGWKRISFVVVMAAAFAAMAFLILTGENVTANQSGANTERVEKNESTKIEVVLLHSIDEVKKAAADHDFLCVILPGPGESNQAVRSIVLSAAMEACDNGTRVGVAELSRDSEGFESVAGSFGVDQFPAILTVKKDGDAGAIRGEISKEQLLKAYNTVFEKKSSHPCPLAGKAGCDPKACGKK